MNRSRIASVALLLALGQGCLPGVFFDENPAAVDSLCPGANRTVAGNVVVDNDVELGAMTGCVAVEGDLAITFPTTSLAALSALAKVGNLQIEATSLDGVELPGLVEAGDITVSGDAALTRFVRIPLLERAGGVDANLPRLEEFSLPSLQTAAQLRLVTGGSLAALDLAALQSADAVEVGLRGDPLAALVLPSLREATLIVAGDGFDGPGETVRTAVTTRSPLRRLRVGDFDPRDGGGGSDTEPTLTGGTVTPSLTTISAPTLQTPRVGVVNLSGLTTIDLGGLQSDDGLVVISGSPALTQLALPVVHLAQPATPGATIDLRGLTGLAALSILPANGQPAPGGVASLWLSVEGLPALTTLDLASVEAVSLLSLRQVGLATVSIALEGAAPRIGAGGDGTLGLEISQAPSLTEVRLTSPSPPDWGGQLRLSALPLLTLVTVPTTASWSHLHVTGVPALDACGLFDTLRAGCVAGTAPQAILDAACGDDAIQTTSSGGAHLCVQLLSDASGACGPSDQGSCTGACFRDRTTSACVDPCGADGECPAGTRCVGFPAGSPEEAALGPPPSCVWSRIISSSGARCRGGDFFDGWLSGTTLAQPDRQPCDIDNFCNSGTCAVVLQGEPYVGVAEPGVRCGLATCEESCCASLAGSSCGDAGSCTTEVRCDGREDCGVDEDCCNVGFGSVCQAAGTCTRTVCVANTDCPAAQECCAPPTIFEQAGLDVGVCLDVAQNCVFSAP